MKKNIINISVIVPGGLNTDIIGLGVNRILKTGELTLGGELKIGPGGKSRNIAQMIAVLAGKNKVAMLGRTCLDPFNLWKLPVDALKAAGVNTDYIKISDYKKSKKLPGIALIPIDPRGQNQIYVFPGINGDFGPADVAAALPLYKSAQKKSGLLVLSLELPLKTAVFSVKKANQFGLKVILDPGGINEKEDYSELLNQEIYLLKPNEHEIKILTGITVNDASSAKKAAENIMRRNIHNVMITLGKRGAYLFTGTGMKHIPVPKLKITGTKDETGCGDQATAAICAALLEGKALEAAAKTAVLAGTIQFNRPGIIPVTKKEIKKYSAA
ncbi:MAG: hypothetical protein A2252_00445 [Elusimicrobia bacterium RIFOXYA2_FULL_39_19]|nr:MAG: hypothetical protein A2252_00445 [Elusimicrobia bacterium RIFOXYA2_FULL_39_19]